MIYLILVLAAYFFMEFIAWISHKYVMHGFLWSLHKDHHFKEVEKVSFFEKNDFFFLIYAIPAITLLFIGVIWHYPFLIAIGVGISLYGLTYFIIHDVIIHHRLTGISQNHNFYMKALVKAHLAHHWAKKKEDFRCFGLLVFPFRFFKL
jgi:beta-carotene 3-hydroxylase